MRRFGIIAAAGVLAALSAGSVEPNRGSFDAYAVASQRVTMSARPTVLRWGQPTTLFGAVDNGREHEIVILQAKDCGLRSFTNVTGAETHEGGTWTTEFGRGVGTTVRAVWKSATATVTLQQQPGVLLDRHGPRRFEVGIQGKAQFWRKRVLFQQRRQGAWKTVKSVVLTDTNAVGRAGFIWTSAEFRATVPRGSVVRAVLPLSQARPCYLAGVSNSLRT